MDLHISADERRRLREVTGELLSPLRYRHHRDWCEAVERPLRQLLGAEASLFALPDGEDLVLSSLSTPPPVVDRIASFFVGFAPGRLRSTDPVLDRVLALRKAAGMEVHTDGMLRPLMGNAGVRSRFVDEVLEPAGIRHHAGMRVGLGMGEADLVVTYGAGVQDAGEEETRVGLLELLLPAFKAGVRQRMQARDWPREIWRFLDTLSQPVMIVDLTGRELHRTRALTRLLEEDAEQDWLLAAVRALGRDMGRLHRRSEASDADMRRLGERELQTPMGRYRILGTYLCDEQAVGGRVGLITLTRLGVCLPSARVLVRQCDLTPRQADVALLLARGLSGQEVADQLVISPHTVRTHTMQLFRKLDIHSRAALALRLLAVEAGGFGAPTEGAPSTPAPHSLS